MYILIGFSGVFGIGNKTDKSVIEYFRILIIIKDIENGFRILINEFWRVGPSKLPLGITDYQCLTELLPYNYNSYYSDWILGEI